MITINYKIRQPSPWIFFRRQTCMFSASDFHRICQTNVKCFDFSRMLLYFCTFVLFLIFLFKVSSVSMLSYAFSRASGVLHFIFLCLTWWLISYLLRLISTWMQRVFCSQVRLGQPRPWDRESRIRESEESKPKDPSALWISGDGACFGHQVLEPTCAC